MKQWLRLLKSSLVTRTALKFILPGGLLLLAAVTALSAWSISQFIQTIRIERESLDLEAKLNDFYQLIQSAETSQRGYLLTGNDEYLKTYLESVPQIPHEIKILSKLAASNPQQMERVEKLRPLVTRRLEDLRITVILMQNQQGGKALAVVNTDEGERLMREIREILDQMDTTLKKDLKIHEAFFQKYSSILLRAIVIGSILAGVLVVLFGYLTSLELKRRSQTEIELKSAQESALIASRLKSQFLATVSHEIRTPLNGIIGMSDVLRTREHDNEKRRFVEVIHRSGQALLRIVNDILDFSKVEAGKIDFEISEFNSANVVADTVELLSTIASEQKLEIKTELDSDIPPVLLGDASRLAQVLRNLVSNALKFTAYGTITVMCKLRFRSDDRVVLRFDVIDTGAGIDANAIPLLFIPFSQVARTPQNRQEGTGLGLSICKALVEQMGGRVGVESTLGRGSDFWFELPFKIASSEKTNSSIDAAFDHRTKASLQSTREISPTLTIVKRREPARSLLVLVVEDNPTNQLIAEAQLDSLGHRSHTVANGEEALEAISRLQYDAVLMDCMMPVLDGYNATLRIRELEHSTGRHLPIIAVTANASAEDRKRCLETGMDEYLAKPFKSDDLELALNRLVSRSTSAIKALEMKATEAETWIDWSTLRDLESKTSADVLNRLLRSFADTAQHAMQEIEASCARGEPEKMRSWAHHLRSSSATLGAAKLAKLCDELEALVKVGNGQMSADLVSKSNELLAAGRASLRELNSEDAKRV